MKEIPSGRSPGLALVLFGSWTTFLFSFSIPVLEHLGDGVPWCLTVWLAICPFSFGSSLAFGMAYTPGYGKRLALGTMSCAVVQVLCGWHSQSSCPAGSDALVQSQRQTFFRSLFFCFVSFFVFRTFKVIVSQETETLILSQWLGLTGPLFPISLFCLGLMGRECHCVYCL